jgi:phosphatidate phosphatase PAH1
MELTDEDIDEMKDIINGSTWYYSGNKVVVVTEIDVRIRVSDFIHMKVHRGIELIKK